MVWYLLALAFGAAAALAGVVLPRHGRVAVSMALGASSCALALVASVQELVCGVAWTVHVTQLLPFSGVTLSLDPLAALFVALTAMVGLAACVYFLGYAHGPTASRSGVSVFMLFVLALLVVPAAANVMGFLFAWELMALSSLVLILSEQATRPRARSAALWYAAMTQAGAVSIVLGLLLVASSAPGQDFAQLAAGAAHLSAAQRSLAFALTLVGFASKAGAVPLHVWLPKAHPEAPSPVSALMSSSMVTMGVYGILRVGEGLLHGGNLWWWVAVAALGVLSAVYGSLHATTARDFKRLLAYSTIDVMGLVLTGVGAAGVLYDTGQREDARLALMASLLLLVAHAAFKGSLFLVAGSVERATGTRNLDRLGGLVHTMPTTTCLVVIGAAAIMALPTLSGFSSEWLLLQGLLHGFADSSTPAVIVMLLGVVALALTGGLGAVAFVKVVGIGFLGQARSEGAATAVEVSRWMRLAAGLLAVPSVVLGLAPGLVVNTLSRAASAALGVGAASPVARGTGLLLSHLSGDIAPLELLVAVVAVLAALLGANRALVQRRARRVAAWGCGREEQTPRMQYTATSFAEPLQRVFSDVLRPQTDVEVTHAVESRYFQESVTYSQHIADVVEVRSYRPLISLVMRLGEGARRLHNGSIHRYLAFGFVALLVVVVVLS